MTRGVDVRSMLPSETSAAHRSTATRVRSGKFMRGSRESCGGCGRNKGCSWSLNDCIAGVAKQQIRSEHVSAFDRFLLAPFPAALFQSLIVAEWPKHGMGIFEHPVSMFAAICLLFYLFGFLLGVPLLLVQRGRREYTVVGYAAAGVAVISLPIVVTLAVVAAPSHLSTYVILYNVAFFVVGGAAAGTLFRYIKGPRISQQK